MGVNSQNLAVIKAAIGVPPGPLRLYGDVSFVANNKFTTKYAVDTPGNGFDASHPYATLAYAVQDSNRMDEQMVILVGEGHTEMVSEASMFSFNNDNMHIFGLGDGNNRPVFTFDTVTSAMLEVNKANLVFENLIFKCGIPNLLKLVAIAKAGALFRNCRFIMNDEGTALVALLGIDITTADADDARFENCEIWCPGNGGDAGIKLSAASARTTILGCNIFGDFDDACVHNPTGQVFTNIEIGKSVMRNTAAGQGCIELESDCTGSIHDNRVDCALAAFATRTAIDPGLCLCSENYGSDDDLVGGILQPAPDAA